MTRIGLGEDLVGLRRAESIDRRANLGVLVGQDRCGQQRGVGRAGHADRQRGDRDAGGHLHDREQRVEPVQCLGLHRHAEHGQRGLGCAHARQVRSAAGARDDDLEATFARGGGVVEEEVRCAVRGDDAHLVRDAQTLEHLGGVFQGVPVGRGPHDDANVRFHRVIVQMAAKNAKPQACRALPAGGGTVAVRPQADGHWPVRPAPAGPASGAVAGPRDRSGRRVRSRRRARPRSGAHAIVRWRARGGSAGGRFRCAVRAWRGSARRPRRA